MAETIYIHWARERLGVLKVAEDGNRRTMRAAAFQNLIEHADPLTSVADASRAIQAWLERIGVGGGRCEVVVPREAVVMRRLQAPQAPADELPDLVRFQTATKTSASIDSLALDFLPVGSPSAETGQHVVTFTMDRDALSRITSVLEGAGLNVTRVAISPLTVAQLVRSARAADLGTTHPDLVVFQQGQMVEISILDEGTLVFSHSTHLPSAEEGDHLKPLKSELTRSLMALRQTHPDVEIQRCFYACSEPDAAVEGLLSERFAGRFEKLDASAVLRGAEDVPGLEALAGAALPELDDRLHVDLLHPRRRREAPDRRRWYWTIGGVSAALILLFGIWTFRSQKADLEAQVAMLQDIQLKNEEDIRKASPRKKAYESVAAWKESATDPALLWSRIQKHLPGPEKMYFTKLNLDPRSGALIAVVTGEGRAADREDVVAMFQAFSENGFVVKPTATTMPRRDPKYPVEFSLNIEIPRPVQETTPVAVAVP